MKPIWGIIMDAFFVAVLLWCSYTDLKRRTVSNLSVAVLLCLGLGHTVLAIMTGSIWWEYPAGMLLGIPFFIAWLNGGMGGGDVKLIVAIGFYLGIINTIVSFFLMIPVLIFFLKYIFIKNRKVKEKIPLAPVILYGVSNTLLLERYVDVLSRIWRIMCRII